MVVGPYVLLWLSIRGKGEWVVMVMGQDRAGGEACCLRLLMWKGWHAVGFGAGRGKCRGRVGDEGRRHVSTAWGDGRDRGFAWV